MSRKPGLGTVSTRTREDAREAAGRISPESPAAAPQVAVAPAQQQRAEAVEPEPNPETDPEDTEDDDAVEPDDEPEQQRTPAASAPAPAPKVSPRGRRRGPALPDSLTPSRVSQRRIQIGPRLRPSIHTDFNDYCLQLANIGVTQSDVVESALVEYMKRYPAEDLRAALIAGE